jgi:tetratricopeptide (TPR) repeat protein
MAGDESKDFFISYNKADQAWAEWIAFELEAAHYTTIIQAWDMRPGSNFVAEMDEAAKCAERTIPVLSSAYLTSDYAFAEWAAAFRHDPKGKLGKVLPVRIERCVVEGLLGPIVYIDLVDLDESQAREQLLAGVKRGRAKPASVAFPGSSTYSVPLDHPAFPGSQPQELLVKQGVDAKKVTLIAEATWLLQQTGWYLTERIRYREAETLLKQALAITEQRKGLGHLDVARDSSALAYLYNAQGKYADAELLYERALAINEQQLGAEHPDTAQSLNNLAGLYESQGKYGDAELLLVRALEIYEQQLGAQHPSTQIVHANYASLLQRMGRDAEGS